MPIGGSRSGTSQRFVEAVQDYRDECRGEHMLSRCLAAQRFPNKRKMLSCSLPSNRYNVANLT